MSGLRTTSISKQGGGVAHPDQGGGFAAGVGRLVRLARAKRGMTQDPLAPGSGASERYLAQIESGLGNPSVVHPQGDRGCTRRADH